MGLVVGVFGVEVGFGLVIGTWVVSSWFGLVVWLWFGFSGLSGIRLTPSLLSMILSWYFWVGLGLVEGLSQITWVGLGWWFGLYSKFSAGFGGFIGGFRSGLGRVGWVGSLHLSKGWWGWLSGALSLNFNFNLGCFSFTVVSFFSKLGWV